MKKSPLIIALSCILFVLTMPTNAQNNQIQNLSNNALSASMEQQAQAYYNLKKLQYGSQLMNESILIDYSYYDALKFSYFNSFIWRIHEDFNENDVVITTNDYGVNDTLLWKFSQAATAFKHLNDSYNTDVNGYYDSLTYDHQNLWTTIDTIFYTYSHINNSGLQNTIRTRILPLTVDGEPDYSATPLWEDIITVDSSLTDVGYVNNRALPVNFTLPNKGDLWAVAVDMMDGDKFTDEFYLLGSYGSPCHPDEPELSSFSPNTYFNPQFSTVSGLSALNSFQDNENLFLDIDGNGAITVGGCERIFMQNWAISCAVTLDTLAPVSIEGTVALTGMDTAMVYLIGYNDTDSSFIHLDSTTTDANGFYEFNYLNDIDSCFIKAALLPNSENYWAYLPTYYNDVELWDQASVLYPNINITGVDINLIAGTNLAGSGLIDGLILDGTGTDPIPNATVILYDENQNPIAYSYADAYGNYSFNDLPIGSYFVTSDVLGLDFIYYSFEITADDLDVSGLNLIAGQLVSNNDSEYLLNGFYLSPNPNNGMFVLKMNESMTNYKHRVEIYSLEGKMALNQIKLIHNL